MAGSFSPRGFFLRPSRRRLYFRTGSAGGEGGSSGGGFGGVKSSDVCGSGGGVGGVEITETSSR
jgi:hypothetical protein